MNEKVMNVFNKNNDQLEKELARRGLPYTICTPCYNKKVISRERAIAEIIYKDAFDCGRSEASHTCPEGCEGKPSYQDYFFKDHEEDITFKFSLTEKQASVFEWLLSEYILNADVFSFYPASQIQDIGRID
jgi:hypothetical protein